jgi:hypothetical protein
MAVLSGNKSQLCILRFLTRESEVTTGTLLPPYRYLLNRLLQL